MLTIEPFIVNPLQENCYIVYDDTNEAVIIDPGAYTVDERTAIVDFITDHQLVLKHCLLTHAHTDHLIGCDTIANTFHVLPEVHVDDQPLIAAQDEMCEYIFGHPLPTDFPSIGLYLTEHDTITFGTHQFTIMHTPGHSPGSVVFISADERVVFTGDTLFQGSIGRTDFNGGSMFSIINSLRRLCQLDDDYIVLPGHGRRTTIGLECATNPFIDR